MLFYFVISTHDISTFDFQHLVIQELYLIWNEIWRIEKTLFVNN